MVLANARSLKQSERIAPLDDACSLMLTRVLGNSHAHEGLPSIPFK
jgi:hypothetical protein